MPPTSEVIIVFSPGFTVREATHKDLYPNGSLVFPPQLQFNEYVTAPMGDVQAASDEVNAAWV